MDEEESGIQKVVSLHGHKITGQINEDLVAVLLGLAEEAQKGEICAISYATVGESGFVGSGWVEGPGPRWPLLSATTLLYHRLHSEVIDEIKAAT